MTVGEAHELLEALAGTHGGLFTRAMARGCGYSDDRIRRMIRNDRWQHVIGSPGVDQVLIRAGRPVTSMLRDQAATLSVARSVMSGPSAARRHGIEVPDRRTWLTVPPGSRVRLPEVCVRRELLAPADVMRAAGMLLTVPARTVVDCVRVLPEEAADELLDRVIRQRFISYEEFVRRVQGEVGRRGVRKLVRAVRAASERRAGRR